MQSGRERINRYQTTKVDEIGVVVVEYFEIRVYGFA